MGYVKNRYRDDDIWGLRNEKSEIENPKSAII
jgi:hypothetical protein